MGTQRTRQVRLSWTRLFSYQMHYMAVEQPSGLVCCTPCPPNLGKNLARLLSRTLGSTPHKNLQKAAYWQSSMKPVLEVYPSSYTNNKLQVLTPHIPISKSTGQPISSGLFYPISAYPAITFVYCLAYSRSHSENDLWTSPHSPSC